MFRRKRRQVEDIGFSAEEKIEQHFFRRLSRFVLVRRFLASWIGICVVLFVAGTYQITGLNKYYQKEVPAGGGVYIEGILGNYTNANPIYAVSAADTSVSKLVFSGLLKFDASGKLVGDLAESWAIDEKQTTYTVKLRPNVKWHDGRPLTAEDVLYTYETIQNPDAKSPLLTSWQGVKLTKVDDRTVQFTVPNVIAAFPNYLVNGIVPKHAFAKVPAPQLRTVRFNTDKPIGTGPFKLEKVEVQGETAETRTEIIALAANTAYFGGTPKLEGFQIRTFKDEKTLLKAYEEKLVTAVSGLNDVPDILEEKEETAILNIPLTGEVGVFFRTSHEYLQDVKVRQALVRSVDQKSILASLGYPVVVADSPLLKRHIGYNKALAQQAYDVAAAEKLLDEAGWKKVDGVRKKDNKPLTFRLYSQNTSDFTNISQKLQEAWKKVGVEVDVQLQDDIELQQVIDKHQYDAVLYGIAIGPDPDVFAYWHSSQADIRSATRLNFSEYKSNVANKALEEGRTRIDPTLRALKYKPFLEAWRADAPAMMFYQPRYVYVVRDTASVSQATSLNTPTDRYSNVQEWTVRTESVNKR